MTSSPPGCHGLVEATGESTGLASTAAGEYSGRMRLKTSITLSEDIVKTVDRETRKGESRSGAIERLLREGLSARARQAADAHDLTLLNRYAEQLNEEAEDVLKYQVDL